MRGNEKGEFEVENSLNGTSINGVTEILIRREGEPTGGRNRRDIEKILVGEVKKNMCFQGGFMPSM